MTVPVAIRGTSYKQTSSLLLRFSRQGEVVAEFNADHVISVELQGEKQPLEPRRYA